MQHCKKKTSFNKPGVPAYPACPDSSGFCSSVSAVVAAADVGAVVVDVASVVDDAFVVVAVVEPDAVAVDHF